MLNGIIGAWIFALGTIFASYAVATAWRLRARELSAMEVSELSKREIKERQSLGNLFDVKITTDYSRCLNCQHRLAWYDLMPVISWLSLGGKCRYCKKAIGWLELLVELGLGLVFVLSWLSFGAQPVLFVWLGLMIIMAILFVYDAKWQLLPTKLLWAAIIVALLFAVMEGWRTLAAGGDLLKIFYQYVLALTILSGLYWLLAKISNQAWVGAGDAYVGAVVALVLGNAWLALVALFVANLIGSFVVVIKAFLTKKSIRRMKIAFGPMLILAMLIVYFAKEMFLRQFEFLIFNI